MGNILWIMLAVNHAQLGVSVVLGLSLYYNQPFFLPLIIFVVFAAVLPDIDHPNSEVGKYFKPVGKVLPHRGVTHSLLGSAIAIYAIHVLTSYDRWFTSFLVIAALLGWNLTKKIMKEHILAIDNHTKSLVSEKQTEALLGILNFIINLFLLIVLVLLWRQEYGKVIFQLISIGYLTHLIGDFVTIEGIPLFWPIKQKFGLRLFRTGGAVEGGIGFLLFCLNTYLIYEFVIKYGLTSPQYWSLAIL
jgi:inner membrane protein